MYKLLTMLFASIVLLFAGAVGYEYLRQLMKADGVDINELIT